jgi:hypothetical protein
MDGSMARRELYRTTQRRSDEADVCDAEPGHNTCLGQSGYVSETSNHLGVDPAFHVCL